MGRTQKPQPSPSNGNSTNEQEAAPQRRLRIWSTFALIVAALAGGGGLTYAAVIWSTDELITPRGWIVVGCTTTCALGVFLGAVGNIQARNRELQSIADKQRHSDTRRINLAVAKLEDLLALIEPLGRVASNVEQQAHLLQTVERNSQQRTKIMRQLAERTVEAVGKNQQRLANVETAVGALPKAMQDAATRGVREVCDRLDDLERDFAGMRVREAQREQEERGGVSRIRQRGQRDDDRT